MMGVRSGDIKMFFDPILTGDYGDVGLDTGDFIRDETLETFVLVSLFTNARVEPEDSLDGDPMGFWGEELLGYNLGSKLWLLGRSKLVNQTFRLAEQYAKESLQPGIDTGLIESIESRAFKSAQNRLQLEVDLFKPSKDIEKYAYELYWQNQFQARGV